MKRAFFKSVAALLPLLGALAAPTSACLAWDGWTAGCGCCQFRFIDDCTLCAWRRTWWGPNALATPLRQYYIPRPPACCSYDGYLNGCGYAVGESFASSDEIMYGNVAGTPGSAYPQEAGAGFSPAHFERLGQIRNELDVAGPVGVSAHASAPAH